MSVIYRILLNFNDLNKNFVHIVNISLSTSINLSCDMCIASFVSSFPGNAIYSLFFQFPVPSYFKGKSRCSLFFHVFPSLLSFLLFPSVNCLRRPFLHKM